MIQPAIGPSDRGEDRAESLTAQSNPISTSGGVQASDSGAWN